jgi:hypothetical protein
MREFKFRAWDGEKMHYCGLERAGNYHQHLDHPIMMYTELADKHGKEIYEDDIVKHTDHDGIESVRRVVYDAPSFKLRRFYNQKRTWHRDAEVIGNIHQNAELLS